MCFSAGPNEVSLRNASAIVPVLGPNGLPKGPRKSFVTEIASDRQLTMTLTFSPSRRSRTRTDWAGRNMTDSAQQLVCLLDVREHARRRRAWSRAFSGAALKGYEEIMGRRVEQLAELFARHAAEGRPATCAGDRVRTSSVSAISRYQSRCSAPACLVARRPHLLHMLRDAQRAGERVSGPARCAVGGHRIARYMQPHQL